MSPARRTWLQALAVLSLGVLGWDAFQPRPDFPIPALAPAPAPRTPPDPDPVHAGAPRITHLSADRVLLPGQRLTVHGRVGGLTPERPATISLEGPDGTMAAVELRDDGSHEAAFALRHPTPVPGPGAFSWKLRLDPSGDPVVLGVRVDEAKPSRVLLLLDHPGAEGARLQRWLGDAGSTVTTRTRISTERHRIASAPGTRTPVDSDLLDASALASLDLVVAHDAALDRLSPDQQADLDLAIRRDGVGLLVLVSSGTDRVAANEGTHSATPPNAAVVRGPAPDPASDGKKALAWSWLRSDAPSTDPPAGQRETRLQLPDGASLDTPVSVLAAELAVPPAEQTLARDPQGRPIVAWASRGRGRWAGSLVLDSWRWRQHGQGDDYARFWSALISVLSRPPTVSTGAWSLDAASHPVFVDQPLFLIWSGAPDAPPPRAEVRAQGAPDDPAIPLTLDPASSASSEARAVFWPVHPGWHTVRALPDGPTLDIHVQPARALPGVRAQRERDAEPRTTRAAVTPRTSGPTPLPAGTSRPWIRLAALLLFVFGAARLWSNDAAPRLRPGPRESPGP